MQPKVLNQDVFVNTSIKHLNLPSVIKIKNNAFGGSQLKSIIVQNCKLIEAGAFVDQYNTAQRNVQV